MENTYEKDNRMQENSNGSSYISGRDYSTSTFQPRQVTENTTPEEDTRYLGQIRTAKGNNNNITNTNNIHHIFILIIMCVLITLTIILLPYINKKSKENKKED